MQCLCKVFSNIETCTPETQGFSLMSNIVHKYEIKMAERARIPGKTHEVYLPLAYVYSAIDLLLLC